MNPHPKMIQIKISLRKSDETRNSLIVDNLELKVILDNRVINSSELKMVQQIEKVVNQMYESKFQLFRL